MSRHSRFSAVAQPLAAGASSAFPAQFTLPVVRKTGSYHIVARPRSSDPSSATNSTENNDWASPAITLSGPNVILKATLVFYPFDNAPASAILFSSRPAKFP